MDRKEYQRQYATKRYHAKRDEILAQRKKKRKTDKVFHDKELQRSREHYHKDPKHHKEQVRRRIEINKKYIRDVKSKSKCVRCPEQHPACLDFHHPQGSKKHNLHQAFDISWSLKRIKEEIAKCEILCANCHRKEHWAYLYDIVEPNQLPNR